MHCYLYDERGIVKVWNHLRHLRRVSLGRGQSCFSSFIYEFLCLCVLSCVHRWVDEYQAQAALDEDDRWRTVLLLHCDGACVYFFACAHLCKRTYADRRW